RCQDALVEGHCCLLCAAAGVAEVVLLECVGAMWTTVSRTSQPSPLHSWQASDELYRGRRRDAITPCTVTAQAADFVTASSHSQPSAVLPNNRWVRNVWESVLTVDWQHCSAVRFGLSQGAA